MKDILAGLIFTLLSISSWATDLNDIYEHLDITSFNSSLRPMQISDEDTFSDFKQLPQPIISNKKIIIEDDYWLLSLEIIKENDQDIHVCFVDKAKEGTYDAQYPLVLRSYGKRYVAIAQKSNVCESFAR